MRRAPARSRTAAGVAAGARRVSRATDRGALIALIVRATTRRRHARWLTFGGALALDDFAEPFDALGPEAATAALADHWGVRPRR